MVKRLQFSKAYLARQAVEANKRAAYIKKCRALMGWIYDGHSRLGSYEEMGERAAHAFELGIKAEDFAIDIVRLSPVGSVVWPLKVDAMKSAAERARAEIDAKVQALAAAGWDLDKVAPRANGATMGYGLAYELACAKRASYDALFVWAQATRPVYDKGPLIVKREPRLEAKHIADAEERAASEYNMYVFKLVEKIGAGARVATLAGSHVWSNSVLTVSMEDGSQQRWHTKQIWNRSKHDLHFPQWPTRRLKD